MHAGIPSKSMTRSPTLTLRMSLWECLGAKENKKNALAESQMCPRSRPLAARQTNRGKRAREREKVESVPAVASCAGLGGHLVLSSVSVRFHFFPFFSSLSTWFATTSHSSNQTPTHSLTLSFTHSFTYPTFYITSSSSSPPSHHVYSHHCCPEHQGNLKKKKKKTFQFILFATTHLFFDLYFFFFELLPWLQVSLFRQPWSLLQPTTPIVFLLFLLLLSICIPCPTVQLLYFSSSYLFSTRLYIIQPKKKTDKGKRNQQIQRWTTDVSWPS